METRRIGRCQRLIWLNPLLRWKPTRRGDDLRPMRNLQSLGQITYPLPQVRRQVRADILLADQTGWLQ